MSRHRRAVSIAFLTFGAVAGTWIPRLPALKDHLHLSDGQIGYALVAYAVGGVLGAAIARMLLGRGARSSVRGGLIAICAALVAPALAGNFAQLVGSIFLLGGCAGFIDLLVNAQAAEMERVAGRPRTSVTRTRSSPRSAMVADVKSATTSGDRYAAGSCTS